MILEPQGLPGGAKWAYLGAEATFLVFLNVFFVIFATFTHGLGCYLSKGYVALGMFKSKGQGRKVE